ncbi:hypothetical protein BS78_04G135000 [Paspalum vaginatum]|nr:hypothetical protein BS78_04G135000 [Paspalum vaginatum]
MAETQMQRNTGLHRPLATRSQTTRRLYPHLIPLLGCMYATKRAEPTAATHGAAAPVPAVDCASASGTCGGSPSASSGTRGKQRPRSSPHAASRVARRDLPR